MSTAPNSKEDSAADLMSISTPSVPWRVAEARSLPGFRLLVRFADGTAGEVDMSEMIASSEAGVFAALRDEGLFARFHVLCGAVTWPGELDLAPDAMYDEIRANGEWVLR
jgi:hypothetical protein